MQLPVEFEKKIQQTFPKKAEEIFASIKKTKKQSAFRLNSSKISSQELSQTIPDPTLESLDLIGKDIFSTHQKHLYTKNPLIFSGSYYFQDLASMLPTLILDISPEDIVLDACASPGSKSTHILSFLGKTGRLIANEINKTRVGRLIENIARWGAENVLICSQDTSQLTTLTQYFDKILVDAPCSGEGMFYKSEESRAEWSPKLVKKCSHLQKQIVKNLLPTLKVGGELVYSTCTLSVEENEEVIHSLLTEYSGFLELVDFSSIWDGGEKGVMTYNGQTFQEEVALRTRRIFPYHQNFQGEAFFIAKFRLIQPIVVQSRETKLRYQNYWDIPKKTTQDYLKEMNLNLKIDHIFALGHFLYYQKVWNKQDLKELIALLHPVYVGCRIGTLKKDWIEPAVESATSLWNLFQPPLILDLNLQEIEKFVLAEPQIINITGQSGFKLITYHQQALGFGKLLQDGTLKSYFKLSQGKKIF